MSDIGVATVNRSPNGVRYVLTDDDSRVIGAVEITSTPSMDIYNVRDSYDEPVPLMSPLYGQLKAAVDHFREWEAKRA